ncbi:peptidoglycan-recognition protein LC isoform X5 [Drosophila grimshawi]|uniref:GH15170 n=1 Tax=Drosophila grimshawi TaxID=7222 RepID=B4IXW1_DROGR|nr:peptidoglycan-recognition protein LC isoform X5 [Drosophila grimshawi]EDV96482.1 GH15170 [Drosophila grimshawi]
MYSDNGTEYSTSTNSNLHIINRINGKNCSTSSTDSGVSLIDNTATYKAEPTSKDNSYKNSTNCDETKQTPEETETSPHRISIEVEAKVDVKQKPSAAAGTGKGAKKSSPALSIRSTTISIVSIDENAIDSSCIDSDSEAEPDDGCTVQKLGQQVTYPPQSDELTQLNKGLTVISRQVVPCTGEGLPAPPTSADIVAKQLLNGNLGLVTPPTPATSQQIGNIALTNTTDVTFGDKHYYEGPVTIQQILIDNREKFKNLDGHENPGYDPQSKANGNAPDDKVNESCKEPVLCPFLPHSISRKAIIITAIFVVLTIILGVILGTTTNLFGKTLNKTTLELLSVAEWGGRQPNKELTKLNPPVSNVIISHTAAESCETREVCEARVKVVQNFHMDGWNWNHVGYNFLVGGDGIVYEGRGWDYQGAHTLGYNEDSIGVSFIGTFVKLQPTLQQLQACQLLLAEGVRLKKLKPDYKLYGHRQLSATESPGEIVYNIIRKWPHWTQNPPLKPR